MSLPALPADIKQYLLFYRLQPKEAAALCSTNKSFSLFCKDRKLRFKILTNYYSNLSLKQLEQEFVFLCTKQPFNLLGESNEVLKYRDSERLEACVIVHPQFLNDELFLLPGSEGMELTCLALAKSNQATLFLLQLGADSKGLGNFGSEKADTPTIEYVASELDQGSKFPILWRYTFNGDVNGILSAMNDKDSRYFYLAYQVKVSPVPESENLQLLNPLEVVVELQANLNEYALYLEFLSQGLDLSEPQVGEEYKLTLLSDFNPIMLKLGMCYGLDVDIPVAGGATYLEELEENLDPEQSEAYSFSELRRQIAQAEEERLSATTTDGSLDEIYLRLDYPLLAYLYQHGHLRFWDNQPFWLNKLRQDFKREPKTTGNLRLEYLQLYQSVVVKCSDGSERRFTNAQYAQGFLYLLHINDKRHEIIQGVEIMGETIEEDYLELLDSLYRIRPNLDDSLIFINASDIPSTKHSFYYRYDNTLYRLQCYKQDFMLGLIEACLLIGINPYNVLSLLETITY